MSRKIRFAIVICGASSIGAAFLPRSFAQTAIPSPAPSASASATEPTPETLGRAKRLFEEGEAYRAESRWNAALDAYLQSRALVPRASSTLDVGVCLYQLGRYDEALDFFEEALTRFPENQLAPEVRQFTKKQIAEIEPKTGRLDISANVDGRLVIDGKPRGKLPLSSAVRLMPGKHVVRIFQDGYVTFERQVEIKASNTTTIEATLEALTTSGRLRIEGDGAEGAKVTVDGADVGTTPWEGTLAPGPHLVMLSKGDLGSAPKLATVIAGQTVSVHLAVSPLSSERRIVLDPPSAELSIDGVRVGHGAWQGRLPRGLHTLEASEEGYVRLRETTDWTTAGPEIRLQLKVDSAHPRWNVGKHAIIGVEIFGGYGFASSFGNDSKSYCVGTSVCEPTKAPSGVQFGATGYYELPSGIQLLIGAGYFSLTRKVNRTFERSPTFTGLSVPATYEATDSVSVSAPFATAGVGYRLEAGAFDFVVRAVVGAAFVRASDTMNGSASASGKGLRTTTQGSGTVVHNVAALVIPELQAGYRFGRVRLAVGVRAPVTLTDGPDLGLGATSVQDGNCTGNDTTIDCIPQRQVVNASHAFSIFATLAPTITLGYRF